MDEWTGGPSVDCRLHPWRPGSDGILIDLLVRVWAVPKSLTLTGCVWFVESLSKSSPVDFVNKNP